MTDNDIIIPEVINLTIQYDEHGNIALYHKDDDGFIRCDINYVSKFALILCDNFTITINDEDVINTFKNHHIIGHKFLATILVNNSLGQINNIYSCENSDAHNYNYLNNFFSYDKPNEPVTILELAMPCVIVTWSYNNRIFREMYKNFNIQILPREKTERSRPSNTIYYIMKEYFIKGAKTIKN